MIETAAAPELAGDLDNPVWRALTGPQAPIALGGGRARGFPVEVSPLAALADDADDAAWRDLADVVEPGQVRALADVPAPPEPWVLLERFAGVQLVAPAAPGPDDDPAALAGARARWDVVPLGAADVPEMLSLVARTEPGPFGPRTHELGGFLGVRVGGELVAMAGQRLRVPGWTEVSGVCTAPELRGRGLAGLLTRLVAAEIRAGGDRPFLHAMAANAAAIRLYQALGYTLRRELTFTVVSRR
jgi:ribosomal protein S18 acetylase RimI-like enzyme